MAKYIAINKSFRQGGSGFSDGSFLSFVEFPDCNANYTLLHDSTT
jgi:hypothetical protein